MLDISGTQDTLGSTVLSLETSLHQEIARANQLRKEAAEKTEQSLVKKQSKLDERLKVMDGNLQALHVGQTMMDKNIQMLMKKVDLMNNGKEQEVRDKIVTPAKEYGKTHVDIIETSTTAIPLSLTMRNLSQDSNPLTQEE